MVHVGCAVTKWMVIDGDKSTFTVWFQHVGMMWAFNDAADEKKKFFVASLLRDGGPVAAWAGTWCTNSKELSSQFQHDPTKFVWWNLLSALRDAYTTMNITGDVKARLRTHQSREIGRPSMNDVLCKALKEIGKALEERNDGKVLQLRRLNLALPFLPCHTLHPCFVAAPSCGTSYYCYPTWNRQKGIDLGPVITAERWVIFLPAVPNPGLPVLSVLGE